MRADAQRNRQALLVESYQRIFSSVLLDLAAKLDVEEAPGVTYLDNSLLVWTRHMHQVSLHDTFVGQGCAGTQAPQPAVSIGAGAMWIDAYAEVTTRAGRYVQGGGCWPPRSSAVCC